MLLCIGLGMCWGDRGREGRWRGGRVGEGGRSFINPFGAPRTPYDVSDKKKCPFAYRTCSAISLLHSWCHVKLLPSRHTFCVHHTPMHQFTLSLHSKPDNYG